MEHPLTITNQTLAIDGGEPIRSASFPPWPVFEQDEIDAVSSVLASGKVNYWTGTQGHQFEREFADYCGVKYAVAVANGTVALELALVALNVGAGDEVIVTARSFFASASSVIMRGARVVFADVDTKSQNITADTIRPLITDRTKAIIAVHLAGLPCDMDSINLLAKKHDLFVIEDCAQAHGASYRGVSVGGLGHVAAFSFCQDKIMSTGGEGGMLVTNDKEIWRRAWGFKDHGKSYEVVHSKSHAPGFRWLHEGFGTNWRMTEMQAVIGRHQLKKLPHWHAVRTKNAKVLQKGFCGIPSLSVPETPAHCGHAWYKFYVFLKREKLKLEWTQERIMSAIVAEGVPCFTGTCSEIYREKAFDDTGMQPVLPLESAMYLGKTSLMFVIHPTLGACDMGDIVAATKKVLQVASI